MGFGHDQREGDAPIPSGALLLLETTALIRTALDAHHFGWIRGSASLEQLEGSARLLLETSGAMGAPLHSGPAAIATRRHRRDRRVEAGLVEDVRLRESWDPPLVSLAGLLGYTLEQIDVST